MVDARVGSGLPVKFTVSSPLEMTKTGREYNFNLNASYLADVQEGSAAATAAASAAATSEENALTYKNAAQTAQTGAETAQAGAEAAQALSEAAQAAAETARDAAFANADVYADIATGLAAVAEGEQFMVVEGDEIVRYEDNAGSAVEVARYPASSFFDFVEKRQARFAFPFTDDSGLVAGGVLADGTLKFKNAETDVSDVVELKSGGSYSQYGVTQGRYAKAVLDANEAVAFGVRHDGTTDIANGEAQEFVAETLNVTDDLQINGLSVRDSITAAAPLFDCSYAQVSSYGQSLSVGGGGTAPAITTVQAYDSLMFNGGTRPQEGGSVPACYASLVPLVESDFNDTGNLYGGDNQGETPLSGFCDCVKQLLASENSITTADQFYKLIGVASGKGAQSITGLQKGTTPYARLVGEPAFAKPIADADNRPYKMKAILWIQGESDSANSNYYNQFQKFCYDANADIKASIGQTDDVNILCYQNPESLSRAIDSLTASLNITFVHVATPIYFLTFPGGGLHLDAAGYKILGAYMGKVHKRLSLDRKIWRPLSPRSFSIHGNAIFCRFWMPPTADGVGKLVVDTTTVAARPNYGFTVFDGSEVAQTISSVNLESYDTIRIVMSSTPAAGWHVKYGLADAQANPKYSGNIRDNEGTSVIFDPSGVNYPLHNWLINFDETI